MSLHFDTLAAISEGVVTGHPPYRYRSDDSEPFGTEVDSLFDTVVIEDDIVEFDFPIPGVALAPNACRELLSGTTEAGRWIESNAGYVVGHFVTHGPRFEYRDFGVHVGQIDQLTFIAGDGHYIEAFFIDCRAGRETFGRKVRATLLCCDRRKLIIPCGVAHSFRNLGGVVTRNDLTLLISPDNPDWNPLNDNLVFEWSGQGLASHPSVAVNTIELPAALALGFYGLQRKSLAQSQPADPRPEASADQPPASQSARLAPPSAAKGPIDLPGCGSDLNYFSEIGPDSWMVIPSTESCNQDLCSINFELCGGVFDFGVHSHTRVFTVMSGHEGVTQIRLDGPKDLSSETPTRVLDWPNDPRYQLRIGPGVRLVMGGRGRLLVRQEGES